MSRKKKILSGTVKSQIKKAVKLYSEFVNTPNDQVRRNGNADMKILSLFANIGVAEAYLKEIGFDVVVANELIERRAILYSKIYPETHMICGDITDDVIRNQIVDEAIKQKALYPYCSLLSKYYS